MASTFISTSIECTDCAAYKLAIYRLKRWSFIALCACCAFGIGGISLSLFLYKKHFKLKKSLDELEAKLEYLSDKIENEFNENKTTKKRDFCKQTSIHSSRRSSLRSECDSYHTPSNSPTRTLKLVEFMLDENEKKYISATKQTVTIPQRCQEDFLSDNRRLELLQMQNFDDKNLVYIQNQAKYENDPSNSKNCIEYIMSLYVLGESVSDLDLKKEIRLKGYNIAKCFLRTNRDSYLTHKWYAIAIGRIIDYQSINDKIKLGFEFKEHLDIAINMHQTDYMLYYLRGRWIFKMCNLSWAERYGVRVIFGKLPDVTIESAMKDFLKVEELHKNKSKASSLYLAKCYINQGNVEEAIKYLKIANELPIRTNEHLIDNEEIESLLQKYLN